MPLDDSDRHYIETSNVVRMKRQIAEIAERNRQTGTRMEPTWLPVPEAKPNVWFTSDLHLGHANIINLCNRPFRDVDHMNQELIIRWNNKVTDADVVFILGDLALGKIDESLELVKLLLGRKMLVPGNHDRVWSGHPKKGRPVRPEDTARYEAAGLYIMDEQIPYVTEEGAPTWTLCHFPDVGDSHDADRFNAWRPKPPHKPGVIVHGHVHEKWIINGPRINVGVDVWNFAPVHQDEVASLAARVWD
jgi:calcineurin-like phosphoesterase family protein